MATNNFSNLCAEIQYLMGNRSEIAAIIPSYIARAESEIYTSMQINPMETFYTLPTVASIQNVPLSPLTGFIGLKTFRIPNTLGIAQLYRDSDWIYANYNLTGTAAGLPQWYGYDANTLVLGPIPDQIYTISGVYYQRLPGLSDTNPTNWLTDFWGELILYGALVKGFEATRDNPTMLSDYRILFKEQCTRCRKYYDKQQVGGSVLQGTV